MKKFLAILMMVLVGNPSYAQCAKEVTLLDKGVASPCTGYLFSPETELKARIATKDNELLKLEMEAKSKQIEALIKNQASYDTIVSKEQEKAELWRNLAEKNTLTLNTMRESRGTRDILFVVLGVGLTVLAGWSIGQAAGHR